MRRKIETPINSLCWKLTGRRRESAFAVMAGIGLSSPNGTGEGVADRPTAVSGGLNFSRQSSSTLNDKLAAAALPPCVEGHGVDNDTINVGRLAAQHILGTGFEFRALLPKARMPLGERGANQPGGVLKGLPPTARKTGFREKANFYRAKTRSFVSFQKGYGVVLRP
jgi:hypothetical protein